MKHNILADNTTQLPYFASLNADAVNMRTGPGNQYTIKFIYNKPGLPIKITDKFSSWYKIQDSEGDEGWIHKSFISPKRNAIIVGIDNQILYSKDMEQINAYLEPNVILSINSCSENYCKVSNLNGDENITGVIARENIWGIRQNEIISE
ncbi:MAG: SH3 domain-containing protein [Pseudomonadota bacterium]